MNGIELRDCVPGGVKVYLDNCCYNRPLDDIRSERIRQESAAVLHILLQARKGIVTIAGSQALDFEIDKMKNQMRKLIVRFFYASATVHIALTSAILARADTFRRTSPMRLLDSLHLACAEYANAAALLTTDDKFEKRGNALDTTVKIMNPIRYLEELP